VRGTMEVREAGPNTLEVTTDHILVYAVRPAGDGGGARGGNRADAASLFTVRRQLRLRLDRDDLREQQVTVEEATLWAGPMSCAARDHDVLRPLTAGQSAGRDDRPPGIDPYVRDGRDTPLCGTLAPGTP
ncbi:MAG TPA: hypothetical protein VFY14_12100, partial [Streptomyces sp.]|nr:hypothetical protein [Streptomyces sp.]